MTRLHLLLTALGAAAMLASGCGGGQSPESQQAAAAPPGAPDSGEVPDAGPADAGTPDAGPSIPLPSAEGWTFLGTAQGGPRHPMGISADASGNIWVAGGEEGLFLLEPGASTFRRFTLDDGLHPYGYPRPDQGTITKRYLNVISVAGGPANTVFVGYMGMPVAAGERDCEDNWDGPNPDPNIYKSGDADRVTLAGDGIQVVHYDISSGLNVVADEARGREKVCNIYRIAYDSASRNLWFGGNHAFAWGDPFYTGNETCFGQWGCSGVMEHAHPLLNGYAREDSTELFALTNYYYGLAVGPSGELWVGGMFRSQRCAAGVRGGSFWDCEAAGGLPANQLDWWPDAVHSDSFPSQRVDDHVSGMAVGSDGALWIGSFQNGLARMGSDGTVGYVGGLVDRRVTSVAADPDGSIWVGGNAGGITRIKGGQPVIYDARVFGRDLASSSVPDIQVDRSGGKRRILVAFRAGAVGIYDGP